MANSRAGRMVGGAERLAARKRSRRMSRSPTKGRVVVHVHPVEDARGRSVSLEQYDCRNGPKHMAVEPVAIARLRPYRGNARTHSKKQIRQIADSIRRFGFTNPVLTSDDDEIIAGHGRVEAARILGMESVPTLRLSHLDAAQRRAYVLADNKLALNAGWDHEVLAIELQALIDLDFDVEITGFSLAEIDLLIDGAGESSPDAKDLAEDAIPPVPEPAMVVTREADLWLLDRHRLLCGDSRNPDTFERLLQGERADLVFTDPPLQCCH
jgi:hypothetical protein